MDELRADLLLTQCLLQVLYNLFEWPFISTAKLLVVGIANTMDLPERLLPKISSRASLERVSFAPYTREQIVTILRSRLGSLKVFDDNALQLCGAKVTQINGDIRRALQLCRRAIELRRQRIKDQGSSVAHVNDDTNAGRITTNDIHEAYTSVRASHHLRLIAAAPYFERVALVALVRFTICSQT